MPDRPSNFALFWGFTTACICGFGGVLPWVRRMVVDKNGWQTAREFTDLFSLCQFLPGPNIINYSVCLGSRFNGIPGAAACLAGVLAAPMTIVLSLGALYARYGQEPVVARGFTGLGAAAAGLVLATALKISAPLGRKPRGMLMAALAFTAIAVLRLPMLPSMFVLAPLSILLHRNAR
jgi:chromate transporter